MDAISRELLKTVFFSAVLRSVRVPDLKTASYFLRILSVKTVIFNTL